MKRLTRIALTVEKAVSNFTKHKNSIDFFNLWIYEYLDILFSHHKISVASPNQFEPN